MESNKTDATTPAEHTQHDLGHDLRTPLAVIRMQAQLLLRKARRGACDSRDEREQFLAGLQRIDDSVANLTAALQKLRGHTGQERRSRAGRPNTLHGNRMGGTDSAL